MTNSILANIEPLSTKDHIKTRLYYNDGEKEACLKFI